MSTPPTTTSTVEERVYARAERLVTVGRAVAEGYGGTQMPDLNHPAALRDALLDLRRIVRSIPGAYAVIIGGLAVQEYGFVRYTQDLDAVVDAASYGAVIEAFRAAGYRISPEKKNLVNSATGAEIDLLKEGVKLKDSTLPLPHPSELGKNLDFVKLPALLGLKIDAGRIQDSSDVVQILKKRLDQIETIRESIPASLQPKFDELAAIARKEAS